MLYPTSAKRSIALLVSGTLVAIVAQMFVALPARADCVYEGEVYQTDETVGPYVCTSDGTMQPR
jgi:hypothetical protein